MSPQDRGLFSVHPYHTSDRNLDELLQSVSTDFILRDSVVHILASSQHCVFHVSDSMFKFSNSHVSIIRCSRYPPSDRVSVIQQPSIQCLVRLSANIYLVPMVANNRELTVYHYCIHKRKYKIYFGHQNFIRWFREPSYVVVLIFLTYHLIDGVVLFT